MLDIIFNYIALHGLIILFLVFVAELLAFPLPGETIMGYAGYLAYQGKMSLPAAIAAVYIGVCTGITIAYSLGRIMGHPFFRKYGRYIHLGPDKLALAENWFDRFGYRMIFAAYFIPGVRHITGYFSGIMETPFHRFALPAYLGAFLYSSVFICLGWIMGPEWDQFHAAAHPYIIMAGIALILGLAVYYRYSSRKPAQK